MHFIRFTEELVLEELFRCRENWKKSWCNTDYRVTVFFCTNYTFISGTFGGGGELAGEGSAQQEVLLLENGASSRATSARRLPLGLRKYWHRRYAGAHTRVHSLLAACLSSRLIPDSSGFSDINVGKHDSHSLNAELRSMLVVPGCCLLERSKACIFRNVERRGTLRRESIFIYRSLVKCFDWQNCEDISRDNDHDRRVGSSWLSGILIQPSSFSNSF